jgi:hypothetical protein
MKTTILLLLAPLASGLAQTPHAATEHRDEIFHDSLSDLVGRRL